MNKWLKIGSVLVIVLIGIIVVTGIAVAQGPGNRGGQEGDGACDDCGQENGQGQMYGRQIDRDDTTRGRGQDPDMEKRGPNGDCTECQDQDGDGVCGSEENGHGPMYRQGDAQENGTQGQGRGPHNDSDALYCDDCADQDGDGECDNANRGARGSGSNQGNGGRMGGRGMKQGQ